MSFLGTRDDHSPSGDQSRLPHWIDQWHFSIDDECGDEAIHASPDDPIVVVGAVEEFPEVAPARVDNSVEEVIDVASAPQDSDLRAMRRQLLLSAAALLEAVDQIDLVLSGRNEKITGEAA